MSAKSELDVPGEKRSSPFTEYSVSFDQKPISRKKSLARAPLPKGKKVSTDTMVVG
jgi:hypothetical protein